MNRRSTRARRAGQLEGISPDRSVAREARIRERRRRRAAGLALATLVLAGISIAGYYGLQLLMPTTTIAVAATPKDATITLIGSASAEATGALLLKDVSPGTYQVEVSRKGFAPSTESVEVVRGKLTELSISLAPQEQDVVVTAAPADAVVTVTHENGTEISGTGTLEGVLPSGQVELLIECPGRETCNESLYLDEAVELTRYLDKEGQVVSLLTQIQSSGAPKGVSITPDGSEVWASILNGPPSVEIFDSTTGEKTGEVDIGTHGAVEIIFNRDGTKAYTSQMETATCFEIDVASRKVVREFDTESAWTKWVELSPDESMLYASNWSGHDVSFINLETGNLEQRIRVSQTPRGMYATKDGKYLYVAGFDSGHLERIDLATSKKEVLFTGGGAHRHVVADEDRGVLYISDMAKNRIWRYDICSGNATKFCDTDQKPSTIALSPDSNVLFISCRGANNPTSYYLKGPEWGSILLVDTNTGRGLDAIIAGNQPTALDVSADGRLLVYSDFLDDQLTVYEAPSYDALLAGNGGRFEARLKEIRK